MVSFSLVENQTAREDSQGGQGGQGEYRRGMVVSCELGVLSWNRERPSTRLLPSSTHPHINCFSHRRLENEKAGGLTCRTSKLKLSRVVVIVTRLK
jgi:hypothetical protein